MNEVRLVVDPQVCVGIGQCEALEPDVFEIDDDGVAVTLGAGTLPIERANAVTEACPSGAISVIHG